MEVVPQEVRFAAAKLAAFNRNRLKLETAGSTTASAGNIVTVTLPENAVIDLKSFKVHMRLTTTDLNANATHARAKLPADVSSLISNFEVYIGGVSVAQSCAEFGSCCKILKIVRSSRDRDGSIDNTLAHGAITTNQAVDDVNVVFTSHRLLRRVCHSFHAGERIRANNGSLHDGAQQRAGAQGRRPRLRR